MHPPSSSQFKYRTAPLAAGEFDINLAFAAASICSSDTLAFDIFNEMMFENGPTAILAVCKYHWAVETGAIINRLQ
jgi:hypothetical protein